MNAVELRVFTKAALAIADATSLTIPPLRRALGLRGAFGAPLVGAAAVALPWLAVRFDDWRRRGPVASPLRWSGQLLN